MTASEHTDWTPLKLALWRVVTDAELNGNRYVVARELTEKLYAAALAALPDGAEPVPVAWQRAAMDETIRKITSMLTWGDVPLSRADTALVEHIKGMPARMTPDFSEAKIGRWLGWAQGAACAKGWLHLDDCKRINREASGAALHPTSETTEEPEKCFICDEPFKVGEMVLHDVNEGLGHRACFGEDRAAYVKDIDTGEPLGPDDPIPEGFPYEPDEARHG